jgi:hypothetical protein
MIDIFRELFRRSKADETILRKMKPFSIFGATGTKRRMVNQAGNHDGATRRPSKTGDRQCAP